MQLLWWTVWRFLKWLNLELPYDLVIPLLAIDKPKRNETYVLIKTCIWMFIAALVIIFQKWKELKCPSIDEWINKMWYIHTMEHYSPIKINYWASLVAQWLRICLPIQGTQVWALVWEDPTCRRATKPMRHNYRACTLEPVNQNYWARVPQPLKPARLEPVLHNKRSHCNEKPAHCNEE